MSEEKFRFKKFEIIQNDLVHKVGTDGVLLGAWTEIKDSTSILDIGTGTGLIAIMLAQRSEGKAKITAIDVDSTAYQTARQNIEQNPFSDLIHLTQSRLQDFKPKTQFDLIVCNPPFFINSLKSPSHHRSQQRHNEDLSFDDILTSITSLLSPSGRLAVILPIEEGELFIDLAQNFGLSLSRTCEVISKVGKSKERYLLEFSYRVTHREKSSLTIMTGNGEWTEEYKELTKEFYLKF